MIWLSEGPFIQESIAAYIQTPGLERPFPPPLDLRLLHQVISNCGNQSQIKKQNQFSIMKKQNIIVAVRHYTIIRTQRMAYLHLRLPYQPPDQHWCTKVSVWVGARCRCHPVSQALIMRHDPRPLPKPSSLLAGCHSLSTKRLRQRPDKPPMHICSVRSRRLFLSCCAKQCSSCWKRNAALPHYGRAVLRRLRSGRGGAAQGRAVGAVLLADAVRAGGIFGQPTVHWWPAAQK